MSKFKIINLLFLTVFMLFTACSGWNDAIPDEPEIANSSVTLPDEWHGLSDGEIISLKKMAALNDSLAKEFPNISTAQPQSAIDVLNQVIILWADAYGMANGFNYGYYANKSNGNLANGLLYAGIYGALYSLAAYIQLSITSSFGLPSNPEIGYMFLEGAVAKTYLNSNSYLTDQNNFTRTYRKTSARPQSSDPIRMASFHNAVVREYINLQNKPIPTTAINQVFNDDDLAIFKSDYSKHIYSNINYYYKGETPPGFFIPPYVMPMYMSNVLRLYKQGLQNVAYKPYQQAIDEIDVLCCEYCNLVEEQTSVDDAVKSQLITSLHVAPASVLLWREIDGSVSVK